MRPDLRGWGLPLGVVAATAAATWPATVDPDLWGHVLYGGMALDAGRLPETNQLAYTTPGHEWVNHEWAFEVLMALAYRHGGSAGLLALRAAFALLTFVPLALAIRRRAGDPRVALVVFLAFSPLVDLGMQTRPQLATCALTALSLLILDGTSGGGRQWPLLVMPAALMAWANLHGGFLVGIALIGVAVATLVPGALRDRDARGRLLAHAACLAASCAATLVNPYGARLWTWLWMSLSRPRPDIVEWFSVVRLREDAASWAIVLAVAFVAILLAREPFPIRFAPAAFAGLAAGSLLHVRHASLMGMAAAVAAAGPLQALFVPLLRRAHAARLVAAAGAAGVLALLLAASMSAARDGLRIRVDPERYPVAMLSLLRQAEVEGGGIVFFNWAQQALWHLPPGARVGLDGRYDTAYPFDEIDRHFNLYFARAGGAAILDDPRATFVMLPPKLPGVRLVDAHPGWTRLREDSAGILWVRAEAATGASWRRVKEAPAVDADGSESWFP